MPEDFERARKRTIVDMWRSGTPFDEIVDYIGTGPDDVARVIFRSLQYPRWLNPYGLTMADESKHPKSPRPVRMLDKTDAQIRALLPGVTTQALRDRLIRSLSTPPASQAETRLDDQP